MSNRSVLFTAILAIAVVSACNTVKRNEGTDAAVPAIDAPVGGDGMVMIDAVPPGACSDGVDNDGDGLIDSADPGCACNGNTAEGPDKQCSNGIDDDGDGLKDFPMDPGCASKCDDDEYTPPACSDTIDNDGDGRIDFPNDPGCDTAADDDETDPLYNPQCWNGADDDGDGHIDYPSDPGCTSAADDLELDGCYPGEAILDLDPHGVAGTTVGATSSTGGSCGGFGPAERVYDFITYTPLESLTISTVDPATLIDTVLYVRTGCTAAATEIACNDNAPGMPTTGSEVTIASPPVGAPLFVFVDEHSGPPGAFHVNLSGVIPAYQDCDLALPSFVCHDGYTCTPSGGGAVCLPTACNNGVDDDGDGRVDYPNDPGCVSIGDGDETDPAMEPQCADGIDNDADGFTDYPADVGCRAASQMVEDSTCVPGKTFTQLTTLDAPVFGSTAGETAFLGGTCGGIGNEQVFAWRDTEPYYNVQLTTQNGGTMIDTVLYVDGGACGDAAGELACNDDSCSFGPCSQQSTLNFYPTVGATYYFVVDTKGAGAGSFELDASGTLAPTAHCNPGSGTFTCAYGSQCREAVLGSGDFTCVPFQCSNGADDDGDGHTDYPNDPGCHDNLDDSEAPDPFSQCSDGLDNDGDGLIDYPADGDCFAASDLFEQTYCVSPDFLNEHDGGSQYAYSCPGGAMTGVLSAPAACDPGAQTASAQEAVYGYYLSRNVANLRISTLDNPNVYDPVLYVRKDDCASAGPNAWCNDNATMTTNLAEVNIPKALPGMYYAIIDGKMGGCFSGNLTITATLAAGASCDPADAVITCGAGLICGGAGVCVVPRCGNGIDDDGDTRVDYPTDPGCVNSLDDSEIDPVPEPQCADGIDNDGDGHIDYPSDPECAAASGPSESCTTFGSDAFGYVGCTATPAMLPCEDISVSGTLVPGAQLDDSSGTVALPFTFDYYGTPETTVTVISNGKLGFPGTTAFTNTCTIEANTIAPYWDDLYPPSGGAGVRYQFFGVAPTRHATFAWDVPHIGGGAMNTPYDIRATIYEGSNRIDFCYVATTSSGDATADHGASATVGLGGPASSLNYECNTGGINNGLLIRFTHP